MSIKTEFNGQIPLRWRLKAWWEGYELADIEKKFLEHLAEQDAIKAAKKAKRLARIRDEAAKFQKKDELSQIRVKITQLVWGEGYCGPGGPEHITAMAKALNLSAKETLLVVGARLGGPARILCGETGVWVNGFEDSKKLAQEANKISRKAGVEKRVQIRQMNLSEGTKFPRIYDNAFSNEIFFTIKNKAQLLATIYDHLKGEGLFLMTDLVLGEGTEPEEPDIQEWSDKEVWDVFPMTSDAMIELMSRCGYRIRVHEDITDLYLEQVSKAWEDADKLVEFMAKEDKNSRENLETVFKESQHWSRRTGLMRKGKLRVMRYLIQKPLA